LYGLIKSNWKNSNTTFEWEISIPPNSSAVIYVLCKSVNDITESGQSLTGKEGIQFIKWENGAAVLEVGSGHYQFKSVTK
jgi:alpha-L-rhamnosidase